MGSTLNIKCGCCSGSSEGNEDFREEDTMKVAENMKSEEVIPTVKMPLLHRTIAERTLPPN